MNPTIKAVMDVGQFGSSPAPVETGHSYVFNAGGVLQGKPWEIWDSFNLLIKSVSKMLKLFIN